MLLFLLAFVLKFCSISSMYSASIGSKFVTITTLAAVNTLSLGRPSGCGKLVGRTNNVYHLSTDEILEVWSTGNLTQGLFFDYSTDATTFLQHFDVNPAQTKMVLLNKKTVTNEIPVYDLPSGTPNQSLTLTVSLLTPSLSKIFVNGLTLYKYHQDQNSGNDSMEVTLLSSSITTTYVFSHSNSTFYFSPNYQYALACTPHSQIYIYNTSDFTLLFIYNQSLTTFSYLTNSIEFSSDNLYAIIEIDSAGALKVLDLRTYQTVYSLVHTGTISGCFFIDSSLVMIVGLAGTFLWEINSNSTVDISLSGVDIQTFSINYPTLFACSANTVTQYLILVAAAPTSNSSYSSGSNTSNVPSGSTNLTTLNETIPNSTTPRIPESSDYLGAYVLVLNYTEAQLKMYDGVGETMSAGSTLILQKIIIFATSTPFTFYFLSFLNFLSFSSLYVLINMPIPDQLFNHLSNIYLSLNSDFLKLINLDPQLQPFTNELVDDDKDLFFGLSSDLLSSSYLMLSFFLLNIFLSELMNHIAAKLKKQSWLKGLLEQNRFEVISGQIISIILPFTLTWRFVFLKTASNPCDKLNISFQYFFVFVSLVFPYFYLFQLILNNKRDLFQQYRSKRSKRQKIPQKMSLILLMSADTWEEWFVCYGNFLYPFFIILLNPTLFLVFLSIYCLFGLMMAFKKQKWRINCILLAFYPLLFHLCFVFFYLSTDADLIANVGVGCLCVLLAGSVHSFFTLLAKIIQTVVNAIKKRSIVSRVQPKSRCQVKLASKITFTPSMGGSVQQKFIAEYPNCRYSLRLEEKSPSTRISNSLIRSIGIPDMKPKQKKIRNLSKFNMNALKIVYE